MRPKIRARIAKPRFPDRSERRINPLSRRALWAALLFGGLLASHAQTVSTDSLNGAKLKILDQQVLDMGDRSVTYNLVETPVLKPQPEPEPAPAVTPYQPTAEELEWIKQQAAKPDVFMFLSCTVFDHGVTEVRWFRDGSEYVIWSSIDFNYLRGLLDIETEKARYQIFLGIGNESRDDVERRNAEVDAQKLDAALKTSVPTLNIVAGTPSPYRVISAPKTGISPEVTQAMDALHRYFDTNRERLVREYEESEAARIAQEEWNKAHPPVPKDVTINYFPIRSNYNGSKASGGAR